MQPCQYFSQILRIFAHSNFNNTLFQWFCGFFGTACMCARSVLQGPAFLRTLVILGCACTAKKIPDNSHQYGMSDISTTFQHIR
jgi:hypothetical protein